MPSSHVAGRCISSVGGEPSATSPSNTIAITSVQVRLEKVPGGDGRGPEVSERSPESTEKWLMFRSSFEALFPFPL